MKMRKSRRRVASAIEGQCRCKRSDIVCAISRWRRGITSEKPLSLGGIVDSEKECGLTRTLRAASAELTRISGVNLCPILTYNIRIVIMWWALRLFGHDWSRKWLETPRCFKKGSPTCMHGFHIAANWKKSCWNSGSMTLRQELTHWNASQKLTRAYAHHILAYRGPYCHPLTKDE